MPVESKNTHVVLWSGVTIGNAGVLRGQTFQADHISDDDKVAKARLQDLEDMGAVKKISDLTDEEKAALNQPTVATVDVGFGKFVPLYNVSDQAEGEGASANPGAVNPGQVVPDELIKSAKETAKATDPNK